MIDYRAFLRPFLVVLSRFKRIIVFLVFIIGFFFFYNTFLIDHTLENLRFSLDQTALAYDVTDLDGLDLLLNQVIIDEVLPGKVNLTNVGNLEYVRNAITKGKGYKVIDSMRTSLDTIIKEKEKKRGAFLVILDGINRYLKDAMGSLSARFRGKKKVREAGKADMELFAAGEELERQGKLSEALAKYNEFIKSYHFYERIGLVELRAANIYQRLGDYNKAMENYRDIIKKHLGDKESYLAQMLLFKLQQLDKLRLQATRLLAGIAELKKEDAASKQEALYRLGLISAQLLNMEEAKKFFKRAAVSGPGTDLGLKAAFNSAWVSKEKNDLEESMLEFARLAKENPASVLALDSRYQIADIFHREGRYQESIDIYVKLAEEYKDDPIASLCLFQAAASYMYDLNDDEKAKEIFRELAKRYPNSPYAKYVAPDNPVGIFVTYLVPRATRVVAWRAGGLLALAGYSGEAAKFKIKAEEKSFTNAFNAWIKSELPDTIGNLFVDIKGTELEFLKGKAVGRGRITMGKFNVNGEAEGRLELAKDGTLNAVLTKAMLEKIPIPPVLINNALTGISLIVRKHFPIVVSKVNMDKGEISVEGYGSKRMLDRLKASMRPFPGIEVSIEDIKEKSEKDELYAALKKRFPESDFSPAPKEDVESLFLDFFTRMYLYLGFKMLETTKDTKFDYERSVRTLGRLLVKKGRFRVGYKELDVNAQLNRLLAIEFPWIVDKEFLFDIKGLTLHFMDNGDVKFESAIKIGHVQFPIKAEEVKDLKVEGKAFLDIDRESRIPRLVFKEISINGRPFNVDKVNLVTLRCLDLLKNGRVPFQLEEASVVKAGVTLRGEGARDFTARVFTDPHLFVIFQIRECDLVVAGIQRLKERPEDAGDYWRGSVIESERTGAREIAQAGTGQTALSTYRD